MIFVLNIGVRIIRTFNRTKKKTRNLISNLRGKKNMGCSDSKSANTQSNNTNQQAPPADQNNKENEAPKQEEAPPQQEDPPQAADDGQQDKEKNTESEEAEEVYVTVEEATTYVSNELGISEEKASKIVQKCNKSDDGKISNKELTALWEEIKAKKSEIRAKFEAYDKDNTGTVSLDEAYEVLKEVFAGIEEKSVRAMIARFDDNNTGKMNLSEFTFFYAHVCVKKEKILQSFNELDKDNSGTLSSEEVCNLLMEECCIERCQAASLVEDFDNNADGKLNKTEFETLFMKLF